MNFLIFRDFSEFILDLCGFLKLKKIIFIPCVDVASDMMGPCHVVRCVHVTWRHMFAHVGAHVCTSMRVCTHVCACIYD